MLLLFTIYAMASVISDSTAYRTSTPVGKRGEFRSPCLGETISFSKRAPKTLVMRTGLVAKTEADRFSYANDVLYVNPVVQTDAGDYVWICGGSFWSIAIKMTLEVTTSEGVVDRKRFKVEWIALAGILVFGCLLFCFGSAALRNRRIFEEQMRRLNILEEPYEDRDRAELYRNEFAYGIV